MERGFQALTHETELNSQHLWKMPAPFVHNISRNAHIHRQRNDEKKHNIQTYTNIILRYSSNLRAYARQRATGPCEGKGA